MDILSETAIQPGAILSALPSRNADFNTSCDLINLLRSRPFQKMSNQSAQPIIVAGKNTVQDVIIVAEESDGLTNSVGTTPLASYSTTDNISTASERQRLMFGSVPTGASQSSASDTQTAVSDPHRNAMMVPPPAYPMPPNGQANAVPLASKKSLTPSRRWLQILIFSILLVLVVIGSVLGWYFGSRSKAGDNSNNGDNKGQGGSNSNEPWANSFGGSPANMKATKMYAGDNSGSIHEIDLETKQIRTFRFLVQGNIALDGVYVNEKLKMLAAAQAGGFVYFYSIAVDPPNLLKMILSDSATTLYGFGQRLFVGSKEPSIFEYDLFTQERVQTFKSAAREYYSIKYSARQDTLYGGSNDGGLVFWDAKVANQAGSLNIDGDLDINDVVLDEANKRLFVLFNVGSVAVLDISTVTPTIIQRFGSRLNANATELTMFPHLKKAYITYNNGEIIQYDWEANLQRSTLMGGHTKPAVSVAQDSEFFFSCSNDGRIIQWRAESGEKVHEWDLARTPGAAPTIGCRAVSLV